jgi:hypothetical protein
MKKDSKGNHESQSKLMVTALVNGKTANIGDDKREVEKHNQWSQRVQNLAEKKFEGGRKKDECHEQVI